MRHLKRVPSIDVLKRWEKEASDNEDGDGYFAGMSDAFNSMQRYMYGNT